MNRTHKFEGFVLAGGRSSRMGHDKAMLEIDGVTMLQRAIDLLRSLSMELGIVGSSSEFPPHLDVRVIPDDWPGAGPLGGIATALKYSSQDWNLIIACDMPYLTSPWLEFLIHRARASSAQAVVPRSDRGPEPMCAAYHKQAEAVVRGALENGVRKVTDGLAVLKVEYIEPDEWKPFDSESYLFKNMNTPADFEEAKATLGGCPKR
jgi:molybdenum cofactor guanylyltransferase